MSTNIDKILESLAAELRNSGTVGTAGIKDTASREQIVINDNGVTVGNLAVNQITGSVKVEKGVVSQNINVLGTALINNGKVSGTLEVDTLKVKNLTTDASGQDFSQPIVFDQDPDGKGLVWNQGNITHQFVYKSDSQRIFSTAGLDLHRNAKMFIDGQVVLEQGRLGDGITTSSLSKLGRLKSLEVDGGADINSVLFVNSVGVGINTDEPKSSLNVVDGLVDIVIGANSNDDAYIGTAIASSLTLGANNKSVITINERHVEFGKNDNKVLVKINGTLEVDRLVSDTRLERSTALEFIGTEDDSIFGKGLVWKGTGLTRQLIMVTNPDRIYSTETIDLHADKSFSINKTPVLSRTSLGPSIVDSHLTSLGELKGLTVNGVANINNKLNVDNSITAYSAMSFRDGSGVLTITGNSLDFEHGRFVISANSNEVLSVAEDGVTHIGSELNKDTLTVIHGALSINQKLPDPDVDLAIGGQMTMSGKKFAVGSEIPTTGSWTKGDIVWNTNPAPTGYVGWVCIDTGRPGTWRPFGLIGDR